MSEQEALKAAQKQNDQVENNSAMAESGKASNEAFDLMKNAALTKSEKPASDSLDGFIPQIVLQTMEDNLANRFVQKQMNLSPEQAKELQKQLDEAGSLQFTKDTKIDPRIPGKGQAERLTYDAKNKNYDDPSLPGELIRGEGTAAVADKTVNEIHDYGGKFRTFMKDFLQRNSIDDKGMDLVQSAHVGNKWGNAAWDGENNRMVYGDGDGLLLKGFIKSDVIGHEMAHGITQYNSNLDYHNQSGALNESFSDCVGIAFKQYLAGQKAERVDKNWLIGEGVFADWIGAKGLRDMLNPGTAYNAPLLGKDPQPADMAHYKNMPDDENNDNGGVHINSGIPNRAFAEAAIALGGNSYDKPLAIWYKTNQKLGGDANGPKTDFKTWANATVETAKEMYGADAAAKVKAAWELVGVLSPAAVAELSPEKKTQAA